MTVRKFLWFYKKRKSWVAFFILWGILSLVSLPRLKFDFSFEQFFPQGDPDLEFFMEFIEDFETDDNFLFIALRNEPNIFDSVFLTKVKELTIELRRLPHVLKVQALPLIREPVRTPLGITTLPLLHLQDKERLSRDGERIMADERYRGTFVNNQGTALNIVIKTKDRMTISESRELMGRLDDVLSEYDKDQYHMLGRAYFQRELSRMQFREVIISSIVSIVLVSFIIILLFRKPVTVFIALSSIGLGLLIFFGLLALLGRELSLMAALYPVLMLIVGTSDVIHITTKYIDEVKHRGDRKKAMFNTIREIGLATLFTSLTTAIGFLSLSTSKIIPIVNFGINASIGVIVAYLVVIGFTCPLLSMTRSHLLGNGDSSSGKWKKHLLRVNDFTREKKGRIVWGLLVFFLFASWGISRITTDYKIQSNLPRGAKITTDFKFFEDEFAGFRPLEFAVQIREGKLLYDYDVITEMVKLDSFIRTQNTIESVYSVATLFKSVNQMLKGGNPEAYVFPVEKDYPRALKYVNKIPQSAVAVLQNKDNTKARITSKIRDIGSESIAEVGAEIDLWINNNIDTSLMSVKRTGTGVIIDKNSEYVRASLFRGLGMAVLIVSLLMGLLYRNIKVLFIAIVPNVIPLLFAAAVLGFMGIELEAGISIIFAIIFGIAVDDSIHFLSKYKLARMKMDRESALRTTFTETGKAITFTTIILFFGFLVLLFSVHPPSVTIGVLISITLVSALVADLLVIPLLLRKMNV